MHAQRTLLSLTVVMASLSSALPSLATAAPTRVENAQSSTVLVQRAKLAAVAFAIDRSGRFLTTEQAASRGNDIKLVFPGGKAFPATREDSDAPAGLAILRVTGAPALRPLQFARANAEPGDQVWTVAPPTRLAEPRRGRVAQPAYPLEDLEGVLLLRQPRSVELTGSPVLNGSGKVVAALRAKRFRFDTHQEAVSVTARPIALAPYSPPEKKDFPAVPVVVGLGILLLLANLWFTMRRRKAAADLVTTVGVAGEDHSPTAAPASSASAADDDLEISLKRPGSAGSDFQSQDPESITDQDPDDTELVSLKRP